MSSPSESTRGRGSRVEGRGRRIKALDPGPSAPTPPVPRPGAASPRTLVTLATYNERDNLPRLVEEVLHVLPDCHILVIDDNSPDGTGRLADEIADREPRLHVLHRTGKLGLGSAILAGMRYAVEHGYDYMVNMDADFSHPPRYLPALVAAMEGRVSEWASARMGNTPSSHSPTRPLAHSPVDVAIGSRYVPGGAIEGWPLARHVMSRAINAYARVLLRLPVRDASGALRCYRVAKLRELDFSRVRSRGYSFQEEILWHLARRGGRMVEVPITFENRRAGASKIDYREAVSALWIMFRLALQ